MESDEDGAVAARAMAAAANEANMLILRLWFDCGGTIYKSVFTPA
jgi:hypothetical protein